MSIFTRLINALIRSNKSAEKIYDINCFPLHSLTFLYIRVVRKGAWITPEVLLDLVYLFYMRHSLQKDIYTMIRVSECI